MLWSQNSKSCPKIEMLCRTLVLPVQIPVSKWTTVLHGNKWLPGQPAILVATTTGSQAGKGRVCARSLLSAESCGGAAVLIESMGKDAAVAELMLAIRTVFPSAPAPSKTLMTMWASDEFSKGTHCHL